MFLEGRGACVAMAAQPMSRHMVPAYNASRKHPGVTPPPKGPVTLPLWLVDSPLCNTCTLLAQASPRGLPAPTIAHDRSTEKCPEAAIRPATARFLLQHPG